MNPKKLTMEQVTKFIEMYPVAPWKELQTEFQFNTQTDYYRLATKLKVKRSVCHELHNRRTYHNEELFSKWNEKSAYLLGYLEADGCFINLHDEKPSVGVRIFASKKDEEYIQQLKKIIEFTGKTTYGTPHVAGNTYYNAGFVISSREWKHFLQNHVRLGCIPKDIPDSVIHHYIRGYFDGDGSVYLPKENNLTRKRRYISFVGSSENLVEEIKTTITEIIGNSKGTEVRKKNNSDKCWYFRIARQELVKKFASWIYQDATIYLKRKQQRLASLI